MKRVFSYIVFACLTGFTATSYLPVVAGGCSSHMNKTAKIKCAEDDTECQTDKAEKLELKKIVESWGMTQISLYINSAPRDLLELVFFLSAGLAAGSFGLI